MAHVTYWHTAKAGAAVAAYRVVRLGNADNTVIVATAATQPIIGVTGRSTASKAGDTVEVAINGVGKVQLGGNVTRGALLTAGTDGRAAATNTAGNRVVGIALASGKANDIVDVLLAAGSV